MPGLTVSPCTFRSCERRSGVPRPTLTQKLGRLTNGEPVPRNGSVPRLVFAKGRYSLIRLMFYRGTFTPEPHTSQLSKSEMNVPWIKPLCKGVDFFHSGSTNRQTSARPERAAGALYPHG